ncbi:hypothetical protein [Pseudomonas sp. UBA4617]|uniref:hypothetical protein n=1 Tax=Pseudomonas sp. UBA4617 TaxID=1947318 RepID=UPI0025D2C70C|nr:hypothetical protein [Pseudomonas sp. UBA4617]
MPDAIGGYFELELRQGYSLYPQALGFNSARSALKVLLRNIGARRLHLPHYICHAVPDAAHAAGADVARYAINLQLELEQLPELPPDELLLYVNYFGLKDRYISDVLAPHYRDRLVVDNSQGLFSAPLPDIKTLYSPRKFVGVPDGGWLANAPPGEWQLPQGQSTAHFGALLGRLEGAPEQHYAAFQNVETQLDHAPATAMSNSTRRVLDSLDYPAISARREANLALLQQSLGSRNQLDILPAMPTAALCYPLLLGTPAQAQAIRQRLLAERIFIPCYWQEVVGEPHSPNIERQLASCLLPLPIDQRYDATHMERLADRVSSFLATT